MRMHRTKHDDNQSIGNRHIFIYVFISFGGNHLERLGLLVPGSRESRRSVICCPAGGRGLLPQWPTANGSRHPNPCGQPPGTRPRNRVNAKPAAAGAASSSASTECGRERQGHAAGLPGWRGWERQGAAAGALQGRHSPVVIGRPQAVRRPSRPHSGPPRAFQTQGVPQGPPGTPVSADFQHRGLRFARGADAHCPAWSVRSYHQDQLSKLDLLGRQAAAPRGTPVTPVRRGIGTGCRSMISTTTCCGGGPVAWPASRLPLSATARSWRGLPRSIRGHACCWCDCATKDSAPRW